MGKEYENLPFPLLAAKLWRMSHPTAPESHLTFLESARLIERLEAESELEYFFRHALIQEATYASLLKSDRRSLHRRVAEALEVIYQLNPEEGYGLLAYHYQQAEISDKAQQYLFKAGEFARARYANQDAIRFYTEALALAPETDLEVRYTIVMARERVYDIIGVRAAQWQDLETMKGFLDALPADPGRLAALLLRQGDYGDKTGDYAKAGTLAQRAIVLAQNARLVELEAQGYFQWGVSLWRRTDYAAAIPVVERARALTQTNHLPALEADSVRLLGVLADSQSDYGAARHYFEDALRLKRAMGDLRGEGQALNSLGVVAFHQSHYLEASQNFSESLRLKQLLGDRAGEVITLQNLGNVLVHMGRLTEAEAHYIHALRASREIRDPDGEASALLGQAQVRLAVGQFESVHSYFGQALALFRQVGDREGEADALAGLGALAYFTRADDVAWQMAQQAQMIAQEISNEYIQGFALTTCGQAWFRLGQWAEAARVYEQAIHLRQVMQQPNLVIESLAGLAQVRLAEGPSALAQALSITEKILTYIAEQPLNGTEDPVRIYLTCYHILITVSDPRASQVLEAGYHSLQDRAAKISDEAMRHSFLENVPSHRELLALYRPGQ